MSHVPADRRGLLGLRRSRHPATERDTAATAIAAAALLKLAQVGPEDRHARYSRRWPASPSPPSISRCAAFSPMPASNKRPDGRPVDVGNRCGLIVGSYYLFESPELSPAPSTRRRLFEHAVLPLDTDISAYTMKGNGGRHGG